MTYSLVSLFDVLKRDLGCADVCMVDENMQSIPCSNVRL